MVLSPAYGRDYANKAAVRADWEANKDFIVASYSVWTGKPVNRAQLVEALSPLDLPVKLVASGLQPALGYLLTQTAGGAGVALLAQGGWLWAKAEAGQWLLERAWARAQQGAPARAARALRGTTSTRTTSARGRLRPAASAPRWCCPTWCRRSA
jgi:hypothetical protein